ncbi:Activating transcription factor 7-interacting protein 2 [Galemys pyrenaicus]|uniref:Activating transcription factor 7-interacting protein 2 n=1 Tax=Galemys pyrenaicus TaxID=202257 RepID=A0A8J6AA54_GALPY|nr:Activating transcription factor 7-interacting protein 2 [Galemys pyrenaicus]
MASPERSKRKILKAKKTMPPSCRKQVEKLNKSKNCENLKTTVTGNSLSSGSQNSSSSVINNKYRPSENISLLESSKKSVCSLGSKVNSQDSVQQIVDSETRLEYTEEQVVCPYQKPSETGESPRKHCVQEAKDSQNSSENHFECQTNVTRSFFEQHEEDHTLKSICSPSSVLNGVVQMPKSVVINSLNDNRISNIASYLETNPNFESCDKRQNDNLCSDTHFVAVDKMTKLVNSVISNNCAANILKSEESCRTCHSSISNCENTDSPWLSSFDTNSSNSHNQKKRMLSDNKENVKRMKTSEQINENICVALEKQTALLEQAVEKKSDSVIDLTKEGQSNCSTKIPVSTMESPTKAVSVSKETVPVVQNTAQVLESFKHLPPLPEPPPLLPELVDKIRDTLPPQKPELKVKRVLRPRGIALTWNITKINPKCAPVESYHLFLCHENPSNKLIWKKIGEIKALPLPMACTLSQFLASKKYYFTVRSKDIFGRYGPFCDIKSIPGFSENLT